MTDVITIGLDLAKNVFQVHGVGETGEVVVRRQLRRSRVIPFFEKLPPCLVGIEACATSHLMLVSCKRSAMRCASCRPTTSRPT